MESSESPSCPSSCCQPGPRGRKTSPARGGERSRWRDRQADFTATFSENGYFVFSYENNQGFVRTVELSAPGQIQFVPPGGGVMTMAVASVVKRPGGVAYVLHTGFERTSGGYLEQQYVTEEADYALTAGGLRVRIVSRAASYFGDRSGSAGGPRNDRIIEGLLKKLP